MKLLSINSIVLLFVVFGLIIPTGAILGDTLSEDQAIVLTPHDGPNGAYAEIAPDGELEVRLDREGLNPDAKTEIANIFTIENRGERPRRIWIEHGSERVQFHTSGEPKRSIEGKEHSVSLAPGRSIAVGITVDTHGANAGEQLLDEIRIVAQKPEPAQPARPSPPPRSGGGTGPSAPEAPSTPSGTPIQPGPETPPTEPKRVTKPIVREGPVEGGTVTAEEVGVVRITFSNTPEQSAAVEITELTELPEDAERQPPRAVITQADVTARISDTGQTSDTGKRVDVQLQEIRRVDRDRDQKLRAIGVDTVISVDQSISLSGSRSLVGSANAIDTERRIVKIVDISVPEELKDQPAAVRLRVDRERFGTSDPRKARIAHRTQDGWQLLDTRVVSMNDDDVVLEAITPGFSIFAVFAENEVRYEWSVEGRGLVTGEQLNLSYEEPGIYNITLTVVDVFGQLDQTTYRVLVNDRPTVMIEAPDEIQAGESTTLKANVVDEFGNTTVTWKFEDGTSAIGPKVDHTFETGDQLVEVTVVDEYGERTTETVTFHVEPARDQQQPLVKLLAVGLPVAGKIALVGLLAILLFAVGHTIRSRSRHDHE